MAKAQTALSRQIFVENKQAALVMETKNLVAKRTRQAKLAIEHGEDAIAKIAVQEKLIQEKQLNLFVQQYDAIQSQTQILKGKLYELQEIYRELQHKKMLLASRANVAQSIKQIQKATESFYSDNIMRGVARAEERILLMEAEVQASSQFTNPLAQYDSTYRNYVNEEELNSEIEKLKIENENQSKAE